MYILYYTLLHYTNTMLMSHHFQPNRYLYHGAHHHVILAHLKRCLMFPAATAAPPVMKGPTQTDMVGFELKQNTPRQ